MATNNNYLSLERCTLCFEHININGSVEVCSYSGGYTQFGSILHTLTRLGNCPFRTRYCCMDCSGKVMTCFENLLEINVAAMLTNRLTMDNTWASVLEEGCQKCATSFLTVEEFNDHFMVHFHEQYVGMQAELENSNDIFDLIKVPGRKKIKSEEDTVSNQRKSEKKKPRKKLKGSSDIDASNCVEVEYELTPNAVITKEDENSIVLIKNEHCYGIDENAISKYSEDEEEKRKMKDRREALIKGLVKKAIALKTDESRVCDLCGQVLNTKISIRNHMARHRKNPNFPLSKRKRSDRMKCKRPRKVENLASNPILCPKCGITFKQNFEMLTHMVLMHNANREQCRKTQARYRLWKCSVCSEQFTNCMSLQKHHDKAHDGVPNDLKVRCEPCGRWYKNSKQLFQHITLKHADTFPYACHVCCKPYMSEKNLLKHMTARHNEADDMKMETVQQEDIEVTEELPDLPREEAVYDSYLLYMGEELNPEISTQDSAPYNYFVKGE